MQSQHADELAVPVPVLPGFHPDPSIVRFGSSYVLVTSSFEYLPGLPVYRSADLVTWALVGHVATRPDQLAVAKVPTMGGAWAPSVRYHDGVLHVIVTDALGRDTLLFTATDPAGPWSDGLSIEIDGIDPDLAWDEEGTCYVTYSVLSFSGPHRASSRSRSTFRPVASSPRLAPCGRGRGLILPEAPHLFRVGDWWYLLLAEGGTERATRSASPDRFHRQDRSKVAHRTRC